MSKEMFQKTLSSTIGDDMVNNQVPSAMAMEQLRVIVSIDIEGLGLRNKEREVIHNIGKNQGATQSDWKKYGLGSGQDFSSNYLSRFHKIHLLAKRQEGRRVHYSLRGIAAIGEKFNILYTPPKAGKSEPR